MWKGDGGSWTHGTVMEHGLEEHSGRSYKIWVTIMGCLIISMQWHVKHTSIHAEYYLHHELNKKNIPQESKRFNELLEIYATLYTSREPGRIGMNDMQIDNEWRDENVTSAPKRQVEDS